MIYQAYQQKGIVYSDIPFIRSIMCDRDVGVKTTKMAKINKNQSDVNV